MWDTLAHGQVRPHEVGRVPVPLTPFQAPAYGLMS